MSAPWWVVVYSGCTHAVDGVERVYGPFNEAEARAVVANPPPLSEFGVDFCAFPLEGVPRRARPPHGTAMKPLHSRTWLLRRIRMHNRLGRWAESFARKHRKKATALVDGALPPR